MVGVPHVRPQQTCVPITWCLASMRGASRVENVHGLISLARNTPACDHTGNGARDAAPPLSLHTGHALCVGGLPGPARAHQGGWQQTGAAAWLPASGVRRGMPLDGWAQCGPPAASGG